MIAAVLSVLLVVLCAVVGTVLGGSAYLVSEAQASESHTVINHMLDGKEIKRDQARRIYLLEERAWTDGQRVRVYRLPEGSAHSGFVRHVLGMSTQDFTAKWDRLVNTGLAPNIVVAENEASMLSLIERKPGAVGYLSKDYIVLNARGHDVKIIKIVD
jgi:ABC-type phosphate transport system substrate-binding protein